MKRILFSVIFVLVFVIGQNCYGQATPGQHNPYQNLAKWYGTQSAPTSYEKAEWALDDINAYRAEIGLKPLNKNVITQGNCGTFPLAFCCFWIFISLILLIIILNDLLRNQREIKRMKCCQKEIEKSKQIFDEIWYGMTESRRRNNIGYFVQKLDREPTEDEIVTGNVH
ncbi:MAG: hypothetical protein LBF88_13025, partial [Planctomycetaceae bacterium]|nr:hypothetical protein [Planctomycetaceae bacterium]